MSFPDKAKREICWNSRDRLWKCLDENNDQIEICKNFRNEYENLCSKQWVKHFDRKREYEKFKLEMQSKDWSDPLNKSSVK